MCFKNVIISIKGLNIIISTDGNMLKIIVKVI